MCEVLPRGRRVRRRMPRHPQCFESDTPTTTTVTRGPLDVYNSNDPREAERQRRWDRSLSDARINEAIQQLHGSLLSEAGRLSVSMSYERFASLGSDSTVAQRIFGSVLQSTLDNIRDNFLERMLPEVFTKLLGAPLTYITGLHSVYDQSQWEQRNNGRRNAFRTQQVYAHLLWVYASTAARGNLNRAIAYNTTLVEQGLRYLSWRTEQLPHYQRWVTQNFTATERGPSIGLHSTGSWNRRR